MANNVTPNYDDERFDQVDADKKQALTDLEQTYGSMINATDSYYQAQIDASKQWAETQQKNQQAQTDFAIEQINQQKAQAEKDYTKEQSGAYVDWQKQSNQYGANAEAMAAQGMANTGYSESSQVSMYNAYQGRVATAREVFARAVLNYDNAIKDARLQNNAILAEIAATALEKQLELGLQGFQYKNTLIMTQADKKQQIDSEYYNRYKDVLGQINYENERAEEIRQYNEQMALNKKKLEEEIRQFNKEYQLKINSFNEEIRQFNAEIARLKAKDAQEHQREIEKLNLQKQQLAAQKEQAEKEHDLAVKEYDLKKKQVDASISLAEKEFEFQKEQANKPSSSGGGGGGGGGGGNNSTINKTPNDSDNSSIDKKYAVNTAYYQGAKNSDCAKYGTFDNGYQPKGINGYGKVTKTGDTITFKTQTLSGQKQTVTQNIWKTPDGSLWYWEGRQNKYVKISSGGSSSKSSSSSSKSSSSSSSSKVSSDKANAIKNVTSSSGKISTSSKSSSSSRLKWLLGAIAK